MVAPHRWGHEEEFEAEDGESHIQITYLGRQSGLTDRVWASQGRGCMSPSPLPIFPIRFPSHSIVYLR